MMVLPRLRHLRLVICTLSISSAWACQQARPVASEVPPAAAADTEMTAIKAVHQCGWGEAAAILFLPAVLIVMLCGVAFLGLMKVAGPSINDILHQMQRLQ